MCIYIYIYTYTYTYVLVDCILCINYIRLRQQQS